MASDFDFVTTDATEIKDALLDALMSYVNEPLYPGDERRIYGEALAQVFVSLYSDFNDTAKQRMLQYARGYVLDAIGERVGAERLQPSAAYGTFRFTVSAPQTINNIVIPQGTRITSDGTFYFATTDAGVLQANTTSVDLYAECLTTGSTYNNYTAGTINVLVDLIPYIETVENITDTTGGDDGEPYTTEGDDRYRERIRLAPSSFSVAGSKSAYEYHALSADPDIIDVVVDSPDACLIDVYILMTGGELPDADTIGKVTDALSADTVRPMCDVVTVRAPDQVEYDIELVYYCDIDDEADAVILVEDSGGAIDQYNDWQITKIGRDINPDQLKRQLMQTVDNEIIVLRADVIQPEYVALSDGQVAKFSGNLTVTHKVV